MVTECERQEIVDTEHLRMLPVFYWVLAGIDVLFSLYGWIYILYGALFLYLPFVAPPDAPDEFPVFFGWLFIALGAGFVAVALAMAALRIFTGFWIKNRRRRMFVLFTAGLTCLFIPFGTIVGVFTFIVLLRPSVIAMFEGQTAEPPRDEDRSTENPRC